MRMPNNAINADSGKSDAPSSRRFPLPVMAGVRQQDVRTTCQEVKGDIPWLTSRLI
jgi:hypothetical protein